MGELGPTRSAADRRIMTGSRLAPNLCGERPNFHLGPPAARAVNQVASASHQTRVVRQATHSEASRNLLAIPGDFFP